MRLLWMLPKVAPALMRHIAGYAELAAYDLARSRRDFRANLLASAIAGVAVFFTLLLACAAVVAATWDTPHRVAAIVWMAGVFLAVAVLALIYRSRAAKEQAPFLASVRREWREDAVDSRAAFCRTRILEVTVAQQDPAARRDAAARDAILARLAQSRAEIRRLLEPPVADAAAGPAPSGSPDGFPRSRTMRTLMSGRGIGTIGAIASGLVLSRPALAWRLIRLLPTSAVARMILARIVRSVGAAAKPRAP